MSPPGRFQLIRAGECEVVVAGGMESMTQAPHLLTKSRSGYKYGDVTMIDHMAYDGQKRSSKSGFHSVAATIW